MFCLSCARQNRDTNDEQTREHPFIRFQSGRRRDGTPVPADAGRQQCPRCEVRALEEHIAHANCIEGDRKVAFVVSTVDNERMMLSLNKRWYRIEAPPERERSLCTTRARAPGSNTPPRRTPEPQPVQLHPVDPGPKGRRVAWKTAVGIRANRVIEPRNDALRRSPTRGWTESGELPAALPLNRPAAREETS